MLFAFQIAYCHRRAAECRELAVRYCANDRECYLQREQAWLKLARSYEFQQRLDRRLTELELSVRCFSVRIACAVFTTLLSARNANSPFTYCAPPARPDYSAAGSGRLGIGTAASLDSWSDRLSRPLALRPGHAGALPPKQNCRVRQTP